MTRKDRIEQLVRSGTTADMDVAANRWMALMTDLFDLTEPEVRGPRFDDVLAAVERAAGTRHDREVGTMIFGT